jgi:7-cyano-7-deazaguanine synthase in queuosine biosynthesis
MTKRVLLFSGGLDSLLAIFFIKSLTNSYPDLLFIPTKHKYALSEFAAVNYKFKPMFKNLFGSDGPKFVDTGHFTTDESMFDFRAIENKNTSEIPFRNLHFILAAASFGYDSIYLVVQKGEQDLSDRRPEFFDRTQQYITWYTGRNILLDAVFPFFTKVRALEWFLNEYTELGQSTKLSMVRSVYSCYEDNAFTPNFRCGACSACVRLFIAYTLNGVTTPDILYRVNPTESPLWAQYVSRAEMGEIEGERASEIRSVCELLGL